LGVHLEERSGRRHRGRIGDDRVDRIGRHRSRGRIY
jgi:hypothetical protein